MERLFIINQNNVSDRGNAFKQQTPNPKNEKINNEKGFHQKTRQQNLKRVKNLEICFDNNQTKNIFSAYVMPRTAIEECHKFMKKDVYVYNELAVNSRMNYKGNWILVSVWTLKSCSIEVIVAKVESNFEYFA